MHHHHDFWWRFVPKEKLVQIYSSMALRSFALSLLGIFLPLYLYQEIGFSFEQMLFFYIFYPTILAVTCPLAAKFCARYGVKHSVLLSMPLYIAFLILLYFMPVFRTPLIVLGTLVGLSLAFYWMGMHQIFHHASDYKHRGEEFGRRRALMVLGTFFGPLVGGVLIKFVGFQIVFGIASLLLLVSAGILFLSEEEHPKYHFSLRSITSKDNWKNSLFFVSRGTELIASGVIWPLFIFVILGDYFSLGIVGSLLAGISAVLVWLSGKHSDHIGKRKIIRWVSGFETLSWILRAMVTTAAHVFGATIFAAITSGIRISPIGAREYDKAQGEIAAYFVSREVFICLGRILMVVFILMTNSLAGGLVFQGFASLAALLF